MKYSKEYYQKNKQKLLNSHKKYRDKPDTQIKLKELRERWKKNNPNYLKNLRKSRRIICIEHYSSGKNCCNCCGENIYEFMSIDHINGGGGKHRKSLNGERLETWLINNNFPEGYQILCHNCNQAKGHHKICPHELIKVGREVYNRIKE